MSENPHLLDSLFDDAARDPAEASPSSSSSDSSTDYVGVAELILKAKIHDKWVSEGEGMFYFDSKQGKLHLVKNNCYFEYLGEGEFQFLRPVGLGSTDPPPPLEPSEAPDCFVGIFSGAELTVLTKKRPREDDIEAPASLSSLVDQADVKVSGLANFLKSWNLLTEDSAVRNLLKQDAERVRFIVSSFSPTTTAKTALLKFVSALSQFPQKWRLQSPEFQSRKTRVDQSPFDLFAGLSIIQIGAEYYVLRTPLEDQPTPYMYLDGMKISVEDGPMGPLKSGSVLTMSQVKDFVVPDTLCVVDIDATS